MATMSGLILGFVSAALAVVTVHQSIILLLNKAGVLPNEPWSLKPVPPLGVPAIVNGMFWGGLWGVVYVLLRDALPPDEAWEKGWLFGLLVALISNFTLLPIIKGSPPFMGGDVKKIAGVLIVLSGFGIATAVIYDALSTGL